MSTEMGADERRIRHLLRRRGVGPDALPPRPATARTATRTTPDSGHWWDTLYAPDAADTHPDTVRTTPDKARIGGGLIPDWRKGPVADLRGRDPDTPDNSPDTTTPDTLGVEPEQDDTTPGKEWEEAEPADESTPQVVRRGRQRQEVTAAWSGLDRRVRWLISTGAAAGVGHGIGLEPLFGQYLASSGHASTGVIGFALAAGGAVVAWKATGMRTVRECLGYLPVPPLVTRLIAAFAAAAMGSRYAPSAAAWLDRHGAGWGLGAESVSLLITSAGGCAALWLLLDQPARRLWWGFRWLCHIPLASALLATCLYAPGVTP